MKKTIIGYNLLRIILVSLVDYNAKPVVDPVR